MYPTSSERQYYEQEIEAVEAKWRLLDDKRRYPWICIGAGATFLLGSLTDRPWANQEAIGTLALLTLVIGGLWLFDLRSRLKALNRRSIALRETLHAASKPD